MSERNLAAVAGIVATAAGLACAELLAAVLPGVPSPVDAVGDGVVAVLPGELVTGAIATLGGANRLVLTVASVLLALGLGGALGRVAWRRAWLAAAIVVGVAALALLATLARPGAAYPTALLALAGAVVVTLCLLCRLLDHLPAPEVVAPVPVAIEHGAPAAELGPAAPARAGSASARPPPGGVAPAGVAATDRRGFLRLAGGAGASAVALGVLGRGVLGAGTAGVEPLLIELPRPSAPLSALPAGQDLATQVAGVSPVLTPTSEFFRIDTAIALPQVDPDGWTLRVGGLVERELEFDLDDLLARDLVEVDATISCVSNEVGGDLVGTARWLGIPLAELLEEAGPTAAAEQVVGRSLDGWTGGFPLEVALDGRDALVAVGMNDEPLPVRHGFPARLVVPGLYGYVSATKWLGSIELMTWEGFDGYWVPRGWAKDGPVKTMSRIDVPGRDGAVDAGEMTVAGVAWAPVRGVAAVEVRVDDAGWRDAALTEPLSAAAWVQWHVEVELSPGVHELAVRAVDGDGERQPEGPTDPSPDGAEGWHTVRVEVA